MAGIIKNLMLFTRIFMRLRRHSWQFIFSLLVNLAAIISACTTPADVIQNLPPESWKTPVETAAIQFLTPTQSQTTRDNPENQFPLWWFSPEIKSEISDMISEENDLQSTLEKSRADYWIDLIPSGETAENLIFLKMFVLSVPFQRYEADISTKDFFNLLFQADAEGGENKVWIGVQDIPYLQMMYPAIDQDRLIRSKDYPEECSVVRCYRISSFEDITPEWRVLAIDENYPFHKTFDINLYPLVLRLGYTINPQRATNHLHPERIASISNFQPDQITSVLISGTTALVRNTALQMEEQGIEFPAQNLGELLRSADITHISNEVPFYSACPPAKPLRKEMRFCSDPDYIGLLTSFGTDVIELTGNHLLDWGPQAFTETLDLYDRNSLAYYGGGRNVEDASKPLVMSVNGNRFAFLGCNVAGPVNDWATTNRPGANQCIPEQLVAEIKTLKAQGYIPIVTIQHYEVEDFAPLTQVKKDFWAYAQAGAAIVSGSQAHFPQGFDFVDQTFIHYGVGNLFFDQMDNWLRKATLDIHYFYEGRYINSEIIGIINENFGQPRLMTTTEANQFFAKMYQYSFYYQGTAK